MFLVIFIHRLLILMCIQEHRFQIFKSAGVKFNDLFLETKLLERDLSNFSMILPLEFSEILNICQNYSLFYISAHFMM